MKKPLPAAIAGAVLAYCALATPTALAQPEAASAMEEMIITAIREDRKSRGATGLDLSVYETPQSLSIINAQTMQDFGLTNINTLLKMATGVNVDPTETDRTTYSARGFDITSMHIDGVGMPFGNLIVGDIDTVIYENVEIIRGSNGLITGLGNPSGTINYVRKRPTNALASSIKLTGGSWDNQRAEVDVSVPLTESGSWAARAVLAYQDADGWLDHYSNNRQVAYVVVDGQLTDTVTLAAGYTHQDNNSDGVLWGAVPALYNDGTAIDYNVSTSTAMDWTYWDTQSDELFAELGWQISDHWLLTTSARQIDYQDNSEIFYVYANTGVGLDAATGLGLLGYPGKYADERDSLVLDASLSGRFNAWGQQHQLQFGVSSARSESEGLSYAAQSGFDVMPPFPGWNGREVPRPAFAAPIVSAEQDIDLDRIYGSLLLALTDNLNLILGASAVDYTNDGVSYGVPTSASEDGTNPYIGFTWEVLDGLNAYGSYSDIYQPQYVLGEDLNPLGSAEGKSYELGLKKAFANNTLLTLALFRTEQSNLEEFKAYGDGDGIDDTDYSDDFDYSLYRGIDVESEGVEIELAGQITGELRLQAGYTHLSLEDENGDEARTFIPRNTLKLLMTWQPQALPKLAMGLSTRWQDDIYFDSAYGRIQQDNYVVVGGYASYAITEGLSVSLNVDNAFDEEYFSSVKYEQVYYAAPRSVNVSASWAF
ncbi:TonB-dependent siderophore receptor [Parahaliea mediterranea]|uniref:TonB-dependent siderophore receptor n=1 Tax=Parahaliea mediterranea TaxID=651086 RepID=UPI000E2F1370|nr:TonB-dependent siderophore receptor [Parahaliea mediterranea]